MINTVTLPRIMKYGGGALLELGNVLKALDLSKPLIVTDNFIFEQGWVQCLIDQLASDGLTRVRVFTETAPEPGDLSILAGIEFLHAGDHDCVIGFGGGSPIDSAKAIAVLGTLPGKIRDYRAPHIQDMPGLPIIAIPTTAGTGSEATKFTIITDEEANEKLLCQGQAYLPTAALIDYELTLTMPARLTADTGIDSLTHALEAYVSRKSNAFSDTFALKAISAIAPNIRTAVNSPTDLAAREAMMLGANFAGIAFSNASVALVHGMSRPVGAFFHVPHGLSNAMLLPVVTQYSSPAAIVRYAECARAMGVAHEDEGDQASVARLLDELAALNSDLEVPSPKDFGIKKSDWERTIAVMASQALASGSPQNNPMVPSTQEIIDLYRQAYR